MADRPRVITAGRRTDVPAFYAPGLLGRLEAGFCHVIRTAAACGASI